MQCQQTWLLDINMSKGSIIIFNEGSLTDKYTFKVKYLKIG